MRTATSAAASAVQDGRYVTVEGEDHGVLAHPDVLAPILTAFYT
jgi:hypothetical protein